MTIVIVEDEPVIRNGLSNIIDKMSADYQVVGTAQDGYEGMLLIKQYHPDLAICDIRMDRVNGLEMIEDLRDLHSKTRFVVLTGYAEFQYAQKALQLGVDDYLLKPVMVDKLRAMLSDMESRIRPKTIISETSAPEKNSYSALVARTVAEIHNYYAQNLSLGDLAREQGVTPEYLSSRFTKETGVNFSVYLKQCRIKKAQELLLQTDKKVYEIALMVGYDDPQYFCRVFKETLGVSPKAFMRQS